MVEGYNRISRFRRDFSPLLLNRLYFYLGNGNLFDQHLAPSAENRANLRSNLRKASSVRKRNVISYLH